MAEYRSNRRRTILILLILSSITLITLDSRGGGSGVGGSVRGVARDAFAPVQDGIDGILSPVQDWWDGVTRSGDIKDENRKLRRQLQAARGAADRAKAAAAENRELKRLAKLPINGSIQAIDSEIILGSPGNFEATVGLNRGMDAGIGDNMPVVSGRGLLGRVSRASKLRSTVLLLTDRDSGVSLRDVRSNAVGVLNGRPEGADQFLDFVKADDDVKPGDELVTAGSEGSPFPSGIPVGRIVSVQKRPGDLNPRIKVALHADASRTEFVRVLVWPVP